MKDEMVVTPRRKKYALEYPVCFSIFFNFSMIKSQKWRSGTVMTDR